MKSRAILVIMLLFGVFPPMVTTTGCGMELHLQQEYQNHARDFARGKKVYDDCKKQYPNLPDPPELVPPTF